MTQAKTVAVLGAGSTGRAMAGFLALSGYRVRLWNRQGGDETDELVSGLAATPELTVSGRLEGTAVLDDVTTDIGAAVTDADVVVVCTTANGHHDVGRLVAGYSAADQAVLLMPAGTLGSLEFVRGLVAGGCIATPLIAETSTTLFGSALDGATGVRISGQKAQVGVASLPSGRTDEIRRLIPEIPFVDVPDVLQSGFENVGASLHVTPMVLNAGWIETHGGTFKYYREAITPAVANVAAQVEEERMRIASAFGYRPTPLSTYLTQSVGAPRERCTSHCTAAKCMRTRFRPPGSITGFSGKMRSRESCRSCRWPRSRGCRHRRCRHWRRSPGRCWGATCSAKGGMWTISGSPA